MVVNDCEKDIVQTINIIFLVGDLNHEANFHYYF